MAKVNGPLLSLGASGAIGKTMVFFPWKGLNAVRQYVVPANPQSANQTTQRGYVTAAAADIHAAQIDATKPLIAADVAAYALWANQQATPRTWWNQATKNYVDVSVAGNTPTTFRGGASTPADGQITAEIYADELDGTDISAGHFFYGTTPTALINSIAATITGGSLKADKAISGLTNGVKYYWQFRVDTGENCEGCMSGIYYSTPAA